MRNRLSALVLLVGAFFLAAPLSAKPWWMRGSDASQTDFLPPDQAFRVSARIDGGQIRVRWVIAEGYYLYRQKMDVTAESPGLTVSPPKFPPGTIKTDPYLGTQEIFTQQVEGTAVYTRADAGAHPIEIRLTYQGCAEAGLCYPPISKVIFPAATAPESSAPGHDAAVSSPRPPAKADALAHAGKGYLILGGACAFFLAGLALRKHRRLALPA
jgi:thiol:disulfide interchange protein DsbD